MMRALYGYVNEAWAKKRRRSGRTACEPKGDHVVFLQGVFVDRAAQGLNPHSLQGEPPTDADVAQVVHTINLRLIRSTARGAVSLERLEHDANGDVLSTFTHPWSDGTTGITRSPVELLEKLAALAPKTQCDIFLLHSPSRCGIIFYIEAI